MFKLSVYVVLILKLTAAFAVANDGLFSDVTAKSVFENSERETPTVSSKGTTLKRLTADSIMETLLAAGFTSRKIDSESVRIELLVETQSLATEVTIKNENLLIRMPLQKIDPQKLSNQQLVALLRPLAADFTTNFVIDSDSNQIELQTAVSGIRLKADDLREQLLAFTAVASNTQKIWKIGTSITSDDAATEPVQIVGKWLATPSTTKAFALQLEQNESFKLVIVDGQTPVKSQGTYQLTDSTLKLTGNDGTSLSGTITLQEDVFELQLNERTSLQFQRVK